MEQAGRARLPKIYIIGYGIYHPRVQVDNERVDFRAQKASDWAMRLLIDRIDARLQAPLRFQCGVLRNEYV